MLEKLCSSRPILLFSNGLKLSDEVEAISFISVLSSDVVMDATSLVTGRGTQLVHHHHSYDHMQNNQEFDNRYVLFVIGNVAFEISRDLLRVI